MIAARGCSVIWRAGRERLRKGTGLGWDDGSGACRSPWRAAIRCEHGRACLQRWVAYHMQRCLGEYLCLSLDSYVAARAGHEMVYCSFEVARQCA
jgi:hypothetical protein